MERRPAEVFAERLLAAIKKAGYTQRSAASKLGVSETVMSNWIRSRNQPSLDDVAGLCRLLGCTADYLLGLVDEPHRTAGIRPVLADAALPPHDVDRLAKRLDAIEAGVAAAREIAGLKK